MPIANNFRALAQIFLVLFLAALLWLAYFILINHLPLPAAILCMRQITTRRTMKQLLPILVGCCLISSSLVHGQSDMFGTLTSNINITGLETQFDPVTGIATATGDVDIRYEGVQIKAGRAEYNSNTGDVMAREGVTVVKDGQIFRGENIIYNVKTEDLTANHIKGSLDPIFYDMDDFSTNLSELERIDGLDSVFTTHDSAVPNYHVKAKTITIYPGDRVVMKNVKVYAGKTPVFWLPFLSQPLDDELGFFFQPGFTSQWGAFLLNQYGVMHGDHTLAKYHFDLRSARGVGVGADYYSMKFRDTNPNVGQLKIYYAYDSDATSGVNDSVRPDSLVDENRYRIAFQHRIFIPGPEKSTWYLDFDITKLSDAFILEDYFLNIFRTDPQPDNHVKLVHRNDNYVATLWGRFQLNEFHSMGERLPELALDFKRMPVFKTGVFYQGQTTAGKYIDKLNDVERFAIGTDIVNQQALLAAAAAGVQLVDAGTLLAEQDEINNELNELYASLAENEYFRAHTYHEFLYPISFGPGNNFQFIPRIGGGATYYGDITGAVEEVNNDTVGIFHLGFDLSTKFSKTWDDVQRPHIGLEGLRHVVQPFINYSYLNADPVEGLSGVDRLTATTRPRPIDVPLFTAIDDLNTWNIARLGVRNLWQTKRYARPAPGTTEPITVTHNWMGLTTFVDAFIEDPEFDRDISNLYNTFFWSPVPWLAFNLDAQLPIGDSDYNFTEANTSITWSPSRWFSWTFGHQFLQDNPIIRDSSLVYSKIYARINDEWGFSMNQIYEMDDSTMQYQSYSIHRDLVSWTAALGGLIRDNGIENEYGVVLTLTLKDFPQVGLPLDLDPNPTGTGGRE